MPTSEEPDYKQARVGLIPRSFSNKPDWVVLVEGIKWHSGEAAVAGTIDLRGEMDRGSGRPFWGDACKRESELGKLKLCETEEIESWKTQVWNRKSTYREIKIY